MPLNRKKRVRFQFNRMETSTYKARARDHVNRVIIFRKLSGPAGINLSKIGFIRNTRDDR